MSALPQCWYDHDGWDEFKRVTLFQIHLTDNNDNQNYIIINLAGFDWCKVQSAEFTLKLLTTDYWISYYLTTGNSLEY